MKTWFLWLVVTLWIISCKTKEMDNYLGIPKIEILQARDELLTTWYPRILDHEAGGYFTNFEYDWKPSIDQPKMLVTQSRGLWTASIAAQVHPGQKVFREAADHGFNFLTEVMWDKDAGGFRQYADDPRDEELKYKMTYANAFALYGLAEYAKINRSQVVLAWVQKTLDWMEKQAYDPDNLGYFNLIIEKPTADHPRYQEITAKLGWGSTQWKDQNSSIHILEALTTTFKVLPNDLVKKRLEEMLILVRDKMINEKGHLNLFFTQDWIPISHADSGRDYIVEHLNFDHVSFGHDIETAFLLIEASKVLYGEVDEKTLQIAKRLIDHSMEHGFDLGYYGLFDRGYRFNQESIEILSREKVWWAQAEAWHSLSLIYKYYPESQYEGAFAAMWKYIQSEMIDNEHGGWYVSGLDENPDSKTKRKAHQWKGPYHDGRALIMVANRMME